MQYHPYVIGIGGGTSSGKTTVAKAIVEKIRREKILVTLVTIIIIVTYPT